MESYTKRSLRCFAYAYKDMRKSEFEELKESCSNFKSEEDRQALESNLTFCALYALQDNLRGSVKKSFEFAKKGGITVRIISGDNVQTATSTAILAGLITESDSHMEGVCMSGEEFKRRVGGVKPIEERNEEGNLQYEVENLDEFRKIEGRLRVLARCNPEDKLTLVTGLKQLGRSTAVTGDSSNDGVALFNAHIGLAMGSGCEVAKDSSDMILINDNFASVLFANMWGRNIYNNIKKFLQFQVTVNIATLSIVFLGCATLGQSPLTIVQLLWVNLIMDTLAALSLATEPPHSSVLTQGRPANREENIMSPIMWRQILGIAAYQFLVMVILMYFGKLMWNLPYETAMFFDGDGNPTNKAYHYTILFNTFIFMQIFNFFNARKLGVREFNMFSRTFNNWLFLGVLALIILAQVAMVEFGGRMFNVAPLNGKQWAGCIIWGAGVLLVSVILKLTPEHWVDKIPVKLDEKNFNPNDPVMAAYNRSKGSIKK